MRVCVCAPWDWLQQTPTTLLRRHYMVMVMEIMDGWRGYPSKDMQNPIKLNNRGTLLPLDAVQPPLPTLNMRTRTPEETRGRSLPDDTAGPSKRCPALGLSSLSLLLSPPFTCLAEGEKPRGSSSGLERTERVGVPADWATGQSRTNHMPFISKQSHITMRESI